jgi:hypothetical protein
VPAWVGAALLGVVIFRSLNQDLGDGDQAADFAQVVNVVGLSVLPFRHLFSQPENRLQALNRTLLVVVAAPTTVALLTMLFRKRVK